MSYVNGGVNMNGKPTKKNLKDQVLANPAKVQFYGTSPLGPQWSGAVSLLPEGLILSVVGPDPYKKRDWFASVERLDGKLVVK